MLYISILVLWQLVLTKIIFRKNWFKRSKFLSFSQHSIKEFRHLEFKDSNKNYF